MTTQKVLRFLIGCVQGLVGALVLIVGAFALLAVAAWWLQPSEPRSLTANKSEIELEQSVREAYLRGYQDGAAGSLVESPAVATEKSVDRLEDFLLGTWQGNAKSTREHYLNRNESAKVYVEISEAFADQLAYVFKPGREVELHERSGEDVVQSHWTWEVVESNTEGVVCVKRTLQWGVDTAGNEDWDRWKMIDNNTIAKMETVDPPSYTILHRQIDK